MTDLLLPPYLPSSPTNSKQKQRITGKKKAELSFCISNAFIAFALHAHYPYCPDTHIHQPRIPPYQPTIQQDVIEGKLLFAHTSTPTFGVERKKKIQTAKNTSKIALTETESWQHHTTPHQFVVTTYCAVAQPASLPLPHNQAPPSPPFKPGPAPAPGSKFFCACQRAPKQIPPERHPYTQSSSAPNN